MSQNNIPTNLIKLGSGDINQPKYGFKAKGLDLASSKNILVPNGYLVPHELLSFLETNNKKKNTLIKDIIDNDNA